MRILLFGATGMVGRGALLEALDDPDVTRVLAVGRRPTGVSHPKLEEALHDDFLDFGGLVDRMRGHDACLFCLGVSAVGMSEEDDERVTYVHALAAAEAFLSVNPSGVFLDVSGMGTDAAGKGRTMWARVKGRTENRLLAMPFRAAYMLRPGFVRPLRGIRSRTRFYRVFYALTRPLAGVMERAMPGSATSTTRLGLAMLEAAQHGAPERVLETRAINALAARRAARRA